MQNAKHTDVGQMIKDRETGSGPLLKTQGHARRAALEPKVVVRHVLR